MMYNTSQFDQYLGHSICLNFFFSAINSKTNSKFEKNAFHYFVDLVGMDTLIYNTLQFNPYSHLLIFLLFFWLTAKTFSFRPKYWKPIWTLEKSLQIFVELIETNPLMYNTLQFDQYSRLSISFNFFGQKFEKEFEILKKLSIYL